MKNIKNIYYCLAFLFIACFAQPDSSLSYFPYHEGDLWQYISQPERIFQELVITKIDTSSDDQFHYLFFNNSENWSFKINLDSSLIYIPLSSLPYYLLDVPIGTIWMREEGVEWVKYYEDRIESKWGIELQTRTYYQYFWNPPDSSSGYSGSAEILAKNIGLLRLDWEGGTKELLGCIIDGKQYGTIVGVKENNDEELINTYQLTNYPNPFNPTTTIKFSILHSQFATLKVYDILGREIKTLLNKPMQPGSYEIEFNGSNLTSGVYFYVLETSGKRISKKMLLIK